MTKVQEYKQCKRCVLDTTSNTIDFDENGICNYCHAFDRQLTKFITIDPQLRKRNLDEMVNYIKLCGENKKYDCILGLSGGVDSTYMAYMAKKLGLRPMAVHFDNGWNSELAVKNIENIVSKLELDLITYVINWEEFKEMQLAYLKASVVDIEVPTDQLIFAALHKIAVQNGIKFILSGSNIVTEYGMPSDWAYRNKSDQTNLLNIYKAFGRGKTLTTLPKFDLFKKFAYQSLHGIQTLALLNYIDFNKAEVKKLITKELNWRDYGGKHYESIFTRFYQGYILPVKFNVDKRKAHLSALICSGQITKEEAIAELEEETYDPILQREDKEFVKKKFDLTELEFQDILKRTRVEHEFYGVENESAFSFITYKAIMALPVWGVTNWRRLRNKLKR
ncbi:MAG: N-acetyl sugar amidotransferase [bacterium]|nr:N-acetyl sugar amidotransferase [bacterium]